MVKADSEGERAGGVLGRSGTGGSRGGLDGGVVCVCFAVLGVPLGSASLTGGGEGVRGLETFSRGSIITFTTLNNVHVCGCVHESVSALE